MGTSNLLAEAHQTDRSDSINFPLIFELISYVPSSFPVFRRFLCHVLLLGRGSCQNSFTTRTRSCILLVCWYSWWRVRRGPSPCCCGARAGRGQVISIHRHRAAARSQAEGARAPRLARRCAPHVVVFTLSRGGGGRGVVVPTSTHAVRSPGQLEGQGHGHASARDFVRHPFLPSRDLYHSAAGAIQF